MDEANQNEGDYSNNVISSPLPSFPNKQSTLKNQNNIKVCMVNDVENIDMGDQEWEVKEEEENKNENKNARNIFGSIVDFITNKNSPDQQDVLEKDQSFKVMRNHSKSQAAIRRSFTSEISNDKPEIQQDKGGLSQRESNSGNDITSKVIGFFTRTMNEEKLAKMWQDTPKTPGRNSAWSINPTKDEKLFYLDSEAEHEWIKMLKYYK